MSTCNFKQLNHGLPLCVLDTSELDEYEQEDCYAELTEQLEDKSSGLRLFTLSVKSGYYEGLQLDAEVLPGDECWRSDYTRTDLEELDDDDAYYYFGQESRAELLELYDREVEQVEAIFNELSAEYGLTKLGVVGVFSNGEAIYREV